jgi:hypothetical protein
MMNFFQFWSYIIGLMAISIFYFILLICFILFYQFRLNARANRKGYNSPIEKNMVGFVFLALTAGLLITAIFLGGDFFNYIYSNFFESINNNNILTEYSFLIFVFILISSLSAAFSLMITKFFLYLLPKKNIRKAGKRVVRIPYTYFCHLFWITGVVLIPLSIVFDWRFYGFLESIRYLFQIWLPLSIASYIYADRAKSPSLSEIQNTELRPPVLYLRSFDQEEHIFAEVARKDIDEYTKYPIYRFGVTIEQFFLKQINQTIGPFFALGNPEDYVAPEGAHRLYAEDGKWKKDFHKLCQQSFCIIMQPGASKNLIWELQAIRATSAIEKFFIITSPPQKSGWWFSLSRKYYLMSNKAKEIKKTSWSEFVNILGKAGYTLNANEQIPGAIFAFDRNGLSILLKSYATSPVEYLNAMNDWIIDKKNKLPQTA